MALCTAGSQPIPTAPPFVWVSWVDANAWLGSVFSKFNWLSYLIPSILYEINAFCAVEPNQPVYPGDAAVAAAAHDPAAFDTVIQYLKDSAVWWVWSHQCECSPVAGGCSSNLSTSDLTSINSPSSVAPNYWWMEQVNMLSNQTMGGIRVKFVNGGETVSLGVHEIGGAALDHFESFTSVAGVHDYLFATPQNLLNGHSYYAVAKENSVGNSGIYFLSTTVISHTFSCATYPQFVYTNTGYGGDATYPGSLGVDFIWGTGPTTPANPPVPTTSIPDVPLGPCTTVGDLCGILQPTIQQVGLLQQRIDLIQRRLLPFAWIAGTPHTGLTGSGSIAVQDILGVIVSLTTVPTRWGSTAETPRRLIPSAASIQASDGTEFQDFHQVHYEHQVIMFDPGWATSVRYNFKPGIVATIVPLLPEP